MGREGWSVDAGEGLAGAGGELGDCDGEGERGNGWRVWVKVRAVWRMAASSGEGSGVESEVMRWTSRVWSAVACLLDSSLSRCCVDID